MNEAQLRFLGLLGAYLLGGIAGIGVPYLRKYLATGEKFSLREIGGKVGMWLLGLVTLPTLSTLLTQIGGATSIVAFGMGLAATFAGHEAQSMPQAVRAARTRGLWSSHSGGGHE